MGLLELFSEGKKYLKDAMPGGLLNQEWTPENVRTAAEVTSMIPNPVGDVASGLLAADDLRKGNYGDAALNGIGLLPFVPAMGGVVKATTPYGQAKELSRRLDKAGIPHELSKSRTTKSAYLKDVETGKGDFDYPIDLRFSDHPSAAYFFGKDWRPDPNYAADVFQKGGNSIDEAEQIIMDLISKTRR